MGVYMYFCVNAMCPHFHFLSNLCHIRGIFLTAVRRESPVTSLTPIHIPPL